MNASGDRSFICPILVGRAEHLDVLDRALHQAKSGGLRTVLLAGEAGIGKSRLVAEATARASIEGLRILKGDCFESGRSLPYSAILEMLRAYLAGHAKEQVVEDLGPEAGEISRLLPELGASLPGPAMIGGTSDAEQDKRRLFHALLRAFGRIAGQRSLLLIFEDLHWSDETTLEFLQLLCRAPQSVSPSAGLLVVMTYRSDEVQPALAHFLAEVDRGRSAVELPLSRLTAAETDVMMRAILDLRYPARRDFVKALHDVTNGNPFFIEEVLKTADVGADSGFGLMAGGRSYQADIAPVPRTVQDALRQRVGLLGEPAKRLLDVAAVSGMRLDVGLMQTVLGEDAGAVLASLKELVAAQLLVEEGTGFAFRHALTRQATYSHLLSMERRSLHRQIGEAIEGMYGSSPEKLEAHVRDLAYHFYEAGVWDKAVQYNERAGEPANGLSAPTAVIQYLTRARDAAKHLGAAPSARSLRLLASAYDVTGEFEHAQTTMREALESARQTGETNEQWEALIGLGVIWSSRDYSSAGDYWTSALDLARGLGDQTLLAHSLNRVGNWHLNIEQTSEAVRHHEEALGIFERAQDTGGIAETVDLLGMTWYIGGDMAKSRAYYERALQLFEQMDDRQGYISSLSTLSVCAPVYHTDTLPPAVTYDQGAEWLQGSHSMAAEIGWRAGESYALFDLGLLLGPAGEYGRALECALDGLAIAEEIDHLAWTCAALYTLGSIQLDILDFHAAQTTLERALMIAKKTGSLHWTRVSAGNLARCYIAKGKAVEAEALLDETFADGAGYWTLGQLAIGTSRAELALASMQPERALALLESLNKADVDHIPPRLGILRGLAFSLVGDRQGAETVFRRAAELAAEQGQRGLLWRAHAALSRLYRETGQRSRSIEERRLAEEVISEVAATLSDETQRMTFISAAMAQLPPEVTARQAAKLAFGGLTERERELAGLIARGLSNTEIAATLVISERTVETHISNILAKLGFSSRSQVAVWSVETGLASRT